MSSADYEEEGGEEKVFVHRLSVCQDVLFEVENGTFIVQTKEGARRILDDVTVRVKGGEALALMGPSGAGKSTLLQLACMSLKGGTITGSVTFNRTPVSLSMFQLYAALVEQYDRHWAFLTVREVMNYTAALCVAGTQEKRAERVEALVQHMGLGECQHTRCGNDLLKGISGGQKKRLSIAQALLKGPAFLFLDEPTSGLDASSAASVTKFLVEWAKKANVVVVATIHQPSLDIFMSFSKVMFMANGRTAYCGRPEYLQAHCESIGKPLPPLTNPADHFMMLINSEFRGRQMVDGVVSAWTEVLPPSEAPGVPIPPQRVSLGKKSWTLFKRMALLSWRDPSLYIGRMVVFLVSNCFFGLVYVDSRSTQLDHATPRFFYTNWLAAVPSMFCIVVTYAVNEEFFLIKKENKNGLVSVAAYFMSNLLLQIPYMMILALFAVAIPAYAIMGYPPANFFHLIAVMAAMTWAFECIGQCFAVAFQNPLIGMLGVVGAWFTSFLFAGIFLKPEMIIMPLRLLCNVSPLRWSFRSAQYLAFTGTTWGEQDLSGEQVLDILNANFAVSSENHVVEDIFIMLGIGAAFKLVFFALLMAKTSARFG